jgi:hypothetical protein
VKLISKVNWRVRVAAMLPRMIRILFSESAGLEIRELTCDSVSELSGSMALEC